MADETPSLHIDTDWKKQAQEEKKRLVEEAKRAAAVPSTPAAPPSADPLTPGRPGGGRPRGETVASFASIIQSFLSQARYFLGELSPQGMEPAINLDMAKYQLDMLSILEDRTKNNLAEDEQRLLDTALYELRMRFVNVASQYI
jgi:hypothetical protein